MAVQPRRRIRRLPLRVRQLTRVVMAQRHGRLERPALRLCRIPYRSRRPVRMVLRCLLITHLPFRSGAVVPEGLLARDRPVGCLGQMAGIPVGAPSMLTVGRGVFQPMEGPGGALREAVQTRPDKPDQPVIRERKYQATDLLEKEATAQMVALVASVRQRPLATETQVLHRAGRVEVARQNIEQPTVLRQAEAAVGTPLAHIQLAN